MQKILDRFARGWPAEISCSSGWYGIIKDLDAELALIDPEYQITQIKEKFGTLRFYFETKSPRFIEMHEIVYKYEEISARTCEISGLHGVLMSKNGHMKTLNSDVADSSYIIIEVNQEKWRK